jgi:hypothetical protein
VPYYEFEDVGTFERFDHWFAGNDPARPCAGDVVDFGDRKGRRLLSLPQQVKTKEFAHVAHGLPPNDPAFPRVDSEGQGVFHNKKEILEYQAKRPGSVWG